MRGDKPRDGTLINCNQAERAGVSSEGSRQRGRFTTAIVLWTEACQGSEGRFLHSRSVPLKCGTHAYCGRNCTSQVRSTVLFSRYCATHCTGVLRTGSESSRRGGNPTARTTWRFLERPVHGCYRRSDRLHQSRKR